MSLSNPLVSPHILIGSPIKVLCHGKLYSLKMSLYVMWKDVEPKNRESVCPNVIMDLYVTQVQASLEQKFQIESSLFLSRVKRLTVYTPCGHPPTRVAHKIEALWLNTQPARNTQPAIVYT
jgi:hypothetical protein